MDAVQIFEEVQRIRRKCDVSHFGNDLLVGPQEAPVGGWKNERDSVVRNSHNVIWDGLEREVGRRRTLSGGIRSGRRYNPVSLLSRSRVDHLFRPFSAYVQWGEIVVRGEGLDWGGRSGRFE